MDLVRNILLQIEEKGGNPYKTIDLDIPDYSKEDVSHHVLLLRDAGFVEAYDLSDSVAFIVKPERMTWAGHEFLDAARNNIVWNHAKEIANEKVGTIPFEVLKLLLIKLVSTVVGLES